MVALQGVVAVVSVLADLPVLSDQCMAGMLVQAVLGIPGSRAAAADSIVYELFCTTSRPFFTTRAIPGMRVEPMHRGMDSRLF